MQTINIGKGIEIVTPDRADFTAEVQDYLCRIGLKNVLGDSHASVTSEKANGGDIQALSRAVAQKKLDALIAGEVRSAAVTREGDPVRAEAKRLAIAAIKAALKKANRKADDKAINAKAKEIMDKYMDKARANIEAMKDADVDLDDLAV